MDIYEGGGSIGYLEKKEDGVVRVDPGCFFFFWFFVQGTGKEGRKEGRRE